MEKLAGQRVKLPGCEQKKSPPFVTVRIERPSKLPTTVKKPNGNSGKK